MKVEIKKRAADLQTEAVYLNHGYLQPEKKLIIASASIIGVASFFILLPKFSSFVVQ